MTSSLSLELDDVARLGCDYASAVPASLAASHSSAAPPGQAKMGSMTSYHGIEIRLDALADLCRRYGVRELAIFGSAVREDFGEHSDVDLLVEFEPGVRIDLIEFLGLQEELSGLFGRKVDLVPRKGLKPRIRDEVVREARVLYAA